MIAKVFDAPLCLTERRLHTPPSALIARRILDARILTVPRRSTLSVTATPFASSTTHRRIRVIDPSTERPFEWEFRRGKELVSVQVIGRLTVTIRAAS